MRGYSVTQTFQGIGTFVVLETITSTTQSYYIAKAWAAVHEPASFDQNIWIITTPTPNSGCVASPVASQLDPTDPAANITVQGVCSTLSNGVVTIVYADSFNWSKGWTYIPAPSERIFVAGGLTVGLYMGNPPGQNLTIDCGMILVEVS